MNGLAVSGILALIFYSLFFNWTYIYIYLFILFSYFALSWIFVPLSAFKYNTARRKLMISTWGDPTSPDMKGHFKVKIQNTLDLCKQLSQSTGEKITITHLVAKALADTLKQYPQATGKLAFGCHVPFKTIDIGCLVALQEGKDLGMICIQKADSKSVLTIAEDTRNMVSSLTKGGDKSAQHKKQMGAFQFLPTCVTGILVEIVAFLVVAIGISAKPLGLRKNPSGTAMITNVGTFNIEVAYPPFPPILRVPIMIALSSIRDEAVVEEGELKVERILTVNVGVDHRFIDGYRVSKMLRTLKLYMEEPREYLRIE